MFIAFSLEKCIQGPKNMQPAQGSNLGPFNSRINAHQAAPTYLTDSGLYSLKYTNQVETCPDINRILEVRQNTTLSPGSLLLFIPFEKYGLHGMNGSRLLGDKVVFCQK